MGAVRIVDFYHCDCPYRMRGAFCSSNTPCALNSVVISPWNTLQTGGCAARTGRLFANKRCLRQTMFEKSRFSPLLPFFVSFIVRSLVPGDFSKADGDGPQKKRLRYSRSDTPTNTSLTVSKDVLWFADVGIRYRVRANDLVVDKVMSDGRTLCGRLTPLLAERGVFLDRVTAGGSGWTRQFFYCLHAIAASAAMSIGESLGGILSTDPNSLGTLETGASGHTHQMKSAVPQGSRLTTRAQCCLTSVNISG